MTRAYFVSDLHLNSPDDARSVLFERFLALVASDPRATHLFLMGDIFDLWLADHDYFRQRYASVVSSLRKLRSGGLEIHYFEGNHDLHLRRFWADELGMHVHQGPINLRLGETKLRLEHGDQMDPDDRGYIFLRWFLRTPPLRFLIHHLPGGLVAWIGERASAHSRTYTSETKTISPDAAIDKIRTHAVKTHGEEAYDLIISGHLHVRDDVSIETGAGKARSVNLGTWLDRPCYFLLDDAGGEFVELDKDDMAQSGATVEAALMSIE